MASVPQPRTPRCWTHHVFMASCEECQDQRRAERDEAARRLRALLR